MKQFYFFLMALMWIGVGFGQTIIFDEAGGGSAPAGWTFQNNVTTNAIDKTTYWLVEAGNPSDFIITTSFDLSSFTSAEFTLNVATFGSGTANSAKIEISYDGGSTYTQTTTSNTPTSSSYVDGGNITLNQVSNQVVIRISNNGTSGRGVRLQNLLLNASGVVCTPPVDQASSESFSSVGTNNATINFTRGTGDRVLVVMREGAAVDTDPVSGTSYTANSEFAGTGASQLGSSNFVVYDGDLNSSPGIGGGAFSLDVTGLNPNTTYYIAAYEYDITDTCYRIPALTGNFTTAAAPIVGFVSATSTVNETNSIVNTSIPVTLSNFEAPVTVAISANPSTTAAVEDYTLNTTELTFDANETLNVSLDINDDADFDDETVVLNISVTSGSAILDISEHTVTILDDDTPPAPSLIITEVADPLDNASEGRFVEIYNNGNTTIDLGAQQIYFARQANGNTISSIALTGTIQPNQVFVIGGSSNFSMVYDFVEDEFFGSITGNGDDGYFLYYGGDEITGFLLDAYGVLGVDGTGEDWEYEDSRAIRINPNTVSPNATWTASEWTIVSANVADMTPGALENEFRYTDVWKPRNANTNATVLDNVLILSGSASVTSNLSVNTVSISSGATLTVNPGQSLTTASDLNNSGTLVLNSTSTQYSSLIVNGTTSGDVTYNRYVNDFDAGDPANSNDLVSPLTAIADVNAFLTGNSNLLSQAGTPTLYAFAPFNNNTGVYENLDSDDTGALIADTGTPLFSRGTGFRAASSGPNQTLQFTGTVATTQVDVTITVGSATNGTEAWNLIGNPFPSYIDFAAFFNDNSTVFDTNAQAVYGYNATTSRWTIWNQATIDDLSETEYIAPGQGFFVKSKTGGGTVSFTPAMRTTLGSDDFIADRSANSVSVARADINLESEGKDFNTIIYFNSNATSNLDPGYDAAAYLGNASGIFTHLAEGNTGVELAIQSLAYNDFNEVTIPLGIKSNGGQAMTISLGTNNTLPESVNVYLEDTANGTFTLLNNNSYTVTPESALNGTGRFFLRFTSGTLSIGDDTANSFNIYHDAATQHIVIAGQLSANTQAYVYDLQGRVVSSNALQASQPEQRIDVSSLSSGVYVLDFENGTTHISQKLIIR